MNPRHTARTVVACLALMFLTTGLRATGFAVLPALAQEAGLSRGVAGMAAVLANAGYAAALWTTDALPGSRRARIAAALVGALAVCLALAATGAGGSVSPAVVTDAAPSPFRTAAWGLSALVAANYCLGLYLGNGVPWLGQVAPPERRGRYMGLHELMAMAAYSVGSLYTGLALPRLGWRGTLLGWAVPMAAVGLGLLALAPEAPQPAPGPRPQGPGRGAGDPAPPQVGPWALAWMGTAFLAIMSGFFGVVPVWAVAQYGASPAAVATAVGTARWTGLLAAPLAGYLADRFWPPKLMAVCLTVAILGLAALPWVPFGWPFVAILALVAFVTGAMSPLYYTTLSRWQAAAGPGKGSPTAVMAAASTAGQVVIPVLMSLALAWQPPAVIYLTAAVCAAALMGVRSAGGL